MTEPKPIRDFETMLHPDTLRSTLLSVSLFVMVFEMFRDRVIEHPKTVHSHDFDEHGWHVDEADYARDVRSRHKNVLQASMLWFVHYGALDASDLEAFDRIRECRNLVVHELSDLLGKSRLNDVGTNFQALYALFRKIEIWWFQSFEKECNPAFDGKTFDDDEIITGPMLAIQMLVDATLGENEQAWRWYNAFVDARKNDSAQRAQEPREG